MNNDDNEELSLENWEEALAWQGIRDHRRAEARKKQWRATLEKEFGKILDEVELLLQEPESREIDYRFWTDQLTPKDTKIKDQASGIISRIISLSHAVVEPGWSGNLTGSLRFRLLQDGNVSPIEKERYLPTRFHPSSIYSQMNIATNA